MRNYIFLCVTLFFVKCYSQKNYETKITGKHSLKYELVKDWPHLPNGFQLSQVSAVGIDTGQNIFIFQRTGRQWTDPFPDSLISSNTIFMLDKETGKIINSWGANLFIMPHGLTVDGQNNVWVTDVALQQVFKFSHDGKLLLKLGIAKTSGNDSVHFNLPTDVAIAHDGSFYVSDGYGNSRIVKFSKDGKYFFAWGKKGPGRGEFNLPHSIALDSHENVYVADRENNRIQEFDATGNFLKEWKNNEATQLYAVFIDKADEIFAVDNLYVNDSLPMGDDILEFDSKLNLLYRFGRNDSSIAPDALYHDIAVDNEGSIYVADVIDRKIQKYKKVSAK